MTTEHSNLQNQPPWEEALDETLLAHLWRPFHQPGVMKTTIAKSILARLERLTVPHSLATNIVEQHGIDLRRFGEMTPIVYAASPPVSPSVPRMDLRQTIQPSQPMTGTQPFIHHAPTLYRRIPIVTGKRLETASRIDSHDVLLSANPHTPQKEGTTRQKGRMVSSPVPKETKSDHRSVLSMPSSSQSSNRRHSDPGGSSRPVTLQPSTADTPPSIHANGHPLTSKSSGFSPLSGHRPNRTLAHQPDASHHHMREEKAVQAGQSSIPPKQLVNDGISRPAVRPLSSSTRLSLHHTHPSSLVLGRPKRPATPVVHETVSSQGADRLDSLVRPRIHPPQIPLSTTPLSMEGHSSAGHHPSPLVPRKQISPTEVARPARLDLADLETPVIEPEESETPEREILDMDALVEKVQRQLRRRFQIETERRGLG